VILVYKGLALRRDLSEVEEPLVGLPSVMFLLPSTLTQQGM
jgi:hypothetical protein